MAGARKIRRERPADGGTGRSKALSREGVVSEPFASRTDFEQQGGFYGHGGQDLSLCGDVCSGTLRA